MADIASLTSTATALAGGASQSSSSLSKLTDDLDNFLTILTAQLQHQDPLEPLDTHEFTNQLVQFSSVEQAIQQNKNLESIIELTQNSMAISAVSYIGKDISATGQSNTLQNGSAEFNYTLPTTAASASISITNEAGDVVYFGQADTATGEHNFVWDGKSSNGGVLQPEGIYKFEIGAVNANEQPISVTHGITGKVSGVEFDGTTAVLSVGKVQVPLTAVTSINDPNSQQPSS
jgi:flagellar basal-body rod modification protein FlgD